MPAALASILVAAACVTSPGSGPARVLPGWAAPVAPPTIVLRGFAPPPSSTPWLPGHRGVDLATQPGAVVRADGAGTVSVAGSVAGVGVVAVDHAGGLRSTFEPVLPTVRVGVRVRAGDVIGHLGVWWWTADPATSRGGFGGHCQAQPCLHWGMLRSGWYVDPLLVTGVAGECRPVRLLPPTTSQASDVFGPPGAPEALRPVGGSVGPPSGSSRPSQTPTPSAPFTRQSRGMVGSAVREASVVVAAGAAPVLLASWRRRLRSRATGRGGRTQGRALPP